MRVSSARAKHRMPRVPPRVDHRRARPSDQTVRRVLVSNRQSVPWASKPPTPNQNQVDARPIAALLAPMRRTLLLLASRLTVLLLGLAAAPALAQQAVLPASVTDHFFRTSDGVRLHYLESGPPSARTLVFVPGWTM